MSELVVSGFLSLQFAWFDRQRISRIFLQLEK